MRNSSIQINTQHNSPTPQKKSCSTDGAVEVSDGIHGVSLKSYEGHRTAQYNVMP